MENKGILPLDSEQKNKNKLRFENLERMKEMEKVEDKEIEEFFTYLNEKFIKKCLALGFDKTAVLELADKGVMDLIFDELLIRQKEEKIKKKFER
jgi:isopentenyl diphosphate isomerase/L-lactate dehydrogenase-like FMN-dependent dehydrogenase